ncbi:hypothetical protein A7P95_10685 [Eikenella longinqua]|uniref:Uncharacterized protein n=2 Tax=Eikenella longinqua TaxID=1795827 RepID=A0A1A9RW00_9NEIS|nr:hypothetical protein A7P95_10685 [Eikenella longinqua]
MLQYAQDAAETDTPWERWETSESKTKIGDEWVQDWEDLTENPDWHPDVGYRRKPQVTRVGRHEFPRPVSRGLSEMDKFYMVIQRTDAFEAKRCVWASTKQDMDALEAGFIHLSREAAQAHADVLNAICRGDVE